MADSEEIDDLLRAFNMYGTLTQSASARLIRRLCNKADALEEERDSLQAQLEAARELGEQVADEIKLSARQYRHNNDNTGTPGRPEQGFVVAYDYEEVNRSLARLTAKHTGIDR